VLRRAAYAAVSPASRVADAIAPRRPAAALDPAASTAAGKINNRAGQSARQPAAQHTLPSQESPIEMITMISWVTVDPAAARGTDPRETYEQPAHQDWLRSRSVDSDAVPAEKPILQVTNPRISV
jgi:hypothetical protein